MNSPWGGRTRSACASKATTRRFGLPSVYDVEIAPTEDGAILILALIFVLIVTFSILGLITFGGVGIKNASNLKGSRSLEYAADGATSAAIQAVRYASLQFGYPPVDCLPDGAVLTGSDTSTISINDIQMVVDCTKTALPLGLPPRSPQDRIVAFYACPTGGVSGPPPSCNSGTAVVSATVDFQDVSPAGIYECSSATDSATCGTGVAITSWVVQTANN